MKQRILFFSTFLIVEKKSSQQSSELIYLQYAIMIKVHQGNVQIPSDDDSDDVKENKDGHESQDEFRSRLLNVRYTWRGERKFCGDSEM